MANSNDDNIIKIREDQRRRADNQIWNAAGEYDFRPQLRAYDDEGKAELYWNSIIGAVKKHFGDELDELWEIIKDAVAEDICTQLLWIGLENACYEREAAERPAFPILRKAYAKKTLEHLNINLPYPFDDVYRFHFCRAAGLPTEEPSEKNEKMYALLNALEFSGEMTGAEISKAAYDLFDERFLLIQKVPEAELSDKHIHFKFLKKKKNTPNAEKPILRKFAGGMGEYGDPTDLGTVYTGKHIIWDMDEKSSDESIKQFVKDIFGTPLINTAEQDRIERTLCSGDHDGCHLYFAKGDGTLADGIKGKAGDLRRQQLKQMDRNYKYYLKHRNDARMAINKLTEKWKNAFLTYRQDNVVRSDYGVLRAERVWREELLNDSRIFERQIQADNGDFTVDILIDGSLSQEERQQRVALQGYIIAESLTRCQIPVRVSSFSSISGYTALTQYRDYHETGKNEEIFHFTTIGGNRDGLAIRLMGHLMDSDKNRAEHRILLLLSDAKPNDAAHIWDGGESVPYRKEISVENTAKEVRYLRNRGISVVCVYTGTDEDLPSAHTIYNRDFVRIRNLEQFAQTVGNLVLTQIRE